MFDHAKLMSFEKRCVICKEKKHASKFKRNRHIYKSCSECAPSNNLIKCLLCNKEKRYHNFQRDSKTYQSCNDCRLGVQRIVEKNFDYAFNVMNEGVKYG